MLTYTFSVLILCSAFLHIYAEYNGPLNRVYLFRPMTMLFIILLAVQAPDPQSTFYQYMIVIGLIASLIGDIFLMLPQDRFLAGLISFLIAHICYFTAFSSGIIPVITPWAMICFLSIALAIYLALLPFLGKMKMPVFIYTLVIGIMGWRALERWLEFHHTSTMMALAGAVLFMISDSVLAVDRFIHKFRLARLTILSTYFTAQWLIALSV